MRKIALAFAMYLITFHASATTGNQLREWMLEEDNIFNKRPGPSEKIYDAGKYFGFVLGTAEAIQGADWCSRPGLANGQILNVVRKYLNDNPQQLDQNAVIVITKALHDALPCKK